MQGIASQVDNTVDVYRSNPKALQKRYQDNPSVINALANQILIQQRQAVANQQLLNTPEKEPYQVVDQQEQKLLTMTKNELADQAKGIMAQREVMQRKNLQRAAKGSQLPEMRAKGGLMPLPRPAMQKMSSGGILGYQTGGPITQEELDKYNERTGSNITFEDLKKDVRNRLKQAIKRPISDPPITTMGRMQKSAAEAKEKTAERAANLDARVEAATKSRADSKAKQLAAKERDRILGLASQIDQTGPGIRPPTPIEKFQSDILTGAPTPPILGSDPSIQQNRVTSAMGAGITDPLTKMAEIDPKKDMEDFAKFADKRAKRGKYDNIRKRRVEGLESQLARVYSPENRKRLEREAFLEGIMTGGGGIGQGLIGGVRARTKQRAAMDNAILKGQENIIEKENKRLDADQLQANKGSELGQRAFEAATKNKREALKALGDFSNADILAADRQAQLIVEQNQNNITNKIRVIAEKNKKELQELLYDVQKGANIGNALEKLLSVQQEIEQTILTVIPEGERLLIESKKEPLRDRDEIEQLSQYLALKERLQDLEPNINALQEALENYALGK
jgi:hypothetical protein